MVAPDLGGFVGPTQETDDGEDYVTICVKRFKKRMVYDPVGDMSEEGGAGTTEEEDIETQVLGSFAKLLSHHAPSQSYYHIMISFIRNGSRVNNHYRLLRNMEQLELEGGVWRF